MFGYVINYFEVFNLDAINFADIESDDGSRPVFAGYHATNLDWFVGSGCEEVFIVLVSAERGKRYFFDDFSFGEAEFD